MDARKMVTMLVGAGLTAAALTAGGSAAQATETTAGQDKIRTLTPYESVLRKQPKTGTFHDYRATTVDNYWSVVVANPASTGDVDLSLYADKLHTQLLASSTRGTGLTDFIAIDSNHRVDATYFPRLSSYGGFGSYTAEFAESAVQLGDGASAIYMGPQDTVAVRDTYLTAGTTYTFTLETGSPSMDGDLFLMASDGTSAGSIRRPQDAVGVGASGGAGAKETFQFTPAVTDWYGVVLLNKLISGTLHVTRTS